ncbi:MAG: hypothetical protein AB7S70_15915 [Hyphomicrobium sp.]
MRKRTNSGQPASPAEVRDVLHVNLVATAQHHLRWLIDFAQRSLGTAEAKHQADNEVLHFCREWYYRRWASGAGAMAMLSFDETLDARRLQPIAKASVAFLEKPDPRKRRPRFYFDDCPVRFSLTWTDTGNLVTFTEGRTAEANFVAAIVSLLDTLREQLRRCARCGRLFSAGRPSQVYCTKRCQNAATSAAYRAAHPKTVTRARRDRRKRQARRQRADALRIEAHPNPFGRP